MNEHDDVRELFELPGLEAALLPRDRSLVGGERRLRLLDALAVGETTHLVVAAAGRDIVLGPVVTSGGEIRRALSGDGAFHDLLAFLAAGEHSGRFISSPLGSVPTGGEERAIDVDQSNESVLVGDRAVVKVFPRTSPGPQPGLDVPAHLASVGFSELPQPYGSVAWRDDEGHEVLLATAAAYLPGARDGWDWWLDIARRGAEPEPTAAAIGALVARLHDALATPSSVWPLPTATAANDLAEAWYARALWTLEEALAATYGDAGERLREREPAIREALDPITTGAGTLVMRIHGDLHVGQILRWDGGDAVGDFDGDPLAPALERVALDSPARDVAAFVRSLDHLGRIVQRDGGDPAVVTSWIARSRVSFLDAYRASLARPELFDESLFGAFEVAQACHEYVYSARYLPRWGIVADLAMSALVTPEPGR